MQLESARALKKEVLQTILSSPAPARAVARPRSLGDVEFSRSETGPAKGVRIGVPSSISLGIAKGKGDDYRLAVRIQRRSELRGPAVKSIVKAASGEVDLRFIGVPKPATGVSWHRGRCDPLRPGASLGSLPQRTTGTLGCFVEPTGGGLALLSAAHVLAGWGLGAPGDEIIQPGWTDRSAEDPAVAELGESVDLGSRTIEEDDCALAVLRDGAGADPVRGLVAAAARGDEPVEKDGRTSGHTQGHVLAFDVGPLEIQYPKVGRLQFDNLIEVDGKGPNPFAAQGDSGSVVTGAEQRALGLLFAVTGRGGRNRRGVSYLAPLDRVLQRLQARLVP